MKDRTFTRFILVRHQTQNMMGICDMERRQIIRYFLYDMARQKCDELNEMDIASNDPYDVNMLLMQLDSTMFGQADKNWIAYNRANIERFDEMLATK